MAPTPNGTANAPSETSSTFPTVVGINFGNSYASIAVLTKVGCILVSATSETDIFSQEGLAECIANEDGERQIACAIAYQGEELVSCRLRLYF